MFVLEKAREAFQHKDAKTESVVLRVAMDTVKSPRAKSKIKKYYNVCLEVAGLTDADVLKQLDTNNVTQQQIKVFCMCGGGFLGHSAATQPHEFYIDTRCGRLPYPKREIMKEVAKLAKMMPNEPHQKMPTFHHCDVFV